MGNNSERYLHNLKKQHERQVSPFRQLELVKFKPDMEYDENDPEL